MSFNDENTRASVRAAHDQVDTLFAHFIKTDATWDSFGKSDIYLEWLRIRLTELLHCTEVELVRRGAVEPQEFGS